MDTVTEAVYNSKSMSHHKSISCTGNGVGSGKKDAQFWR